MGDALAPVEPGSRRSLWWPVVLSFPSGEGVSHILLRNLLPPPIVRFQIDRLMLRP